MFFGVYWKFIDDTFEEIVHCMTCIHILLLLLFLIDLGKHFELLMSQKIYECSYVF